MKPITIIPDNQIVSDSEKFSVTVPDDKKIFYLIAPLIDKNKTEENNEISDPLTSIDSIPKVWKLFESFIEDFKASPVEGALYDISSKNTKNGIVSKKRFWEIDLDFLNRSESCSSPVNLLEYIEAIKKFTTLSDSYSSSVYLEEGGIPIDFKRFALERLSFHTPHTKIFYRLNRPLPSIVLPSSPFSSSAYPNVTTHAEYVTARYNLHVRDMEQELLAVRRVENWNDLAVWISEDGATKKRRRKSSNSSNSDSSITSSSLIIPELAQVFPCEYSLFRLGMLIPRVSFEIERQLRISQFFEDKIPSSIPTPAHLRQVEALTASTASLSYSYEQLEVLGDSFLKYYSTLDTLLVGSSWSEGRLSSHRQQILCNSNLRNAAEKLDVTTYASFTPFFSKLWSPPALPIEVELKNGNYRNKNHSNSKSSSSLDKTLNKVLFSPEGRWKALATVEGKQVQNQVVYTLNPSGKLEIISDYKTKEQTKNSTGNYF